MSVYGSFSKIALATVFALPGVALRRRKEGQQGSALNRIFAQISCE